MSILPLLTVQDLRVEASGQTLLTVPALEIRRGEVLVVLGANGAGKSTLLQTLAFLRTPTSGRLQFDGEAVSFHAPSLTLRRRLAVVFQEPLLFDTTVEANVASGLKLRGIARATIQENVHQWLERLGIAHLAQRQARILSGGEAQRVSLARAFVLEPDFLLLDEPFSALDAPTRESLTDLFLRLQQQTQTTTLFVTHDRQEALRLASRLAVMERGAIAQIGTPEEVFSQPVSETVASFVGIETILRGTIDSQRDGFAEVDVGTERRIAVASSLSSGSSVTLCLRPEEVTLLALSESATPSSARNYFHARVTHILPWGSMFKVHLDCGFPLVAFVTRPSIDILHLHEGRTVATTFKATAVHVIAHPNP
jgi:tungstate transport system ATP-binding protein